ncbi:FKBP12-associated protein [Beauveria asiatica]|uniref:FKBP12-associated protein n=1 Tax=Beauveria asiatica TaxID=1069075 RepID=A0AAW0RX23_9HYPO
MPENQGNSPHTPSQGSSRGRYNHGRRRGRSDRGPRPNNGPFEGSADTPSVNGSVHSSPAPPQEDPTRGSNSRSRGNRNRPSKRQTGVSGSAPTRPRPAGRRAFGGHLSSTTEASNELSNSSSSAPAGLSVDAPEFVPGQPIVPRSRVAKPAPSRPKQTRPKLPKSTASDLATRIHEDINNANYECTVCTDEVLRTSHIWSCTLCWTVVHMKCAKKWHSNQMKQEEPQSAQMQNESSWRCPACNSKLSDDPGTYHFCRYRPILVVKHVRSHVRLARILVHFNAILAPVRPAALWAQSNRAFAAKTHQESFAGRPTTNTAGAVRTPVVICCPVANMCVKYRVIADSVANAQCK